MNQCNGVLNIRALAVSSAPVGDHVVGYNVALSGMFLPNIGQ